MYQYGDKVFAKLREDVMHAARLDLVVNQKNRLTAAAFAVRR